MPKWRVQVLLPAVSLCMTMVPWNGSLKSITRFTLLITIITRQVIEFTLAFGDGIFCLGCWVKILGFQNGVGKEVWGGGGLKLGVGRGNGMLIVYICSNYPYISQY